MHYFHIIIISNSCNSLYHNNTPIIQLLLIYKYLITTTIQMTNINRTSIAIHSQFKCGGLINVCWRHSSPLLKLVVGPCCEKQNFVYIRKKNMILYITHLYILPLIIMLYIIIINDIIHRYIQPTGIPPANIDQKWNI